MYDVYAYWNVQQLVAISPDGTRFAYNASGRLRVRSLGEAESRAITDVVVDGDIVVENRRLVRVDQQEIEARVRATTSTWGGGGA